MAKTDIHSVVELPQPLPTQWEKHASSKTGRTFYVNKVSGESHWDFPHESFALRQWSPSAACTCEVASLRCIMHRDAEKREYVFESLQEIFFADVMALAVENVSAIVHIGCGHKNELLLSRIVTSSAPTLVLWETDEKVLEQKRAFLKLKTSKQLIFEHINLLDGQGLSSEANAPIGKALVVCGDTAQCCWDTAAHARRFLRKVSSLLHPQNGVALFLIPDARMIMENTADGCTAFARRDGEVIEAEGAHWPADFFLKIVYGARYAHKAVEGGVARIQWLVSRPTLEHASAAVGLSVASMCNATTFLSQLGIGKATPLEANKQRQQRHVRAEAAWNDLLEKCGGNISAHDWESIRFWAVAVLVPRDAENVGLALQEMLPNE